MTNVTHGVPVIMEVERRAFDSLPREIREVIARAPFDYKVSDWAKEYRAFAATGGGDAVRLFRRRLIEHMARDMQRWAYLDYGPDHPEVARNRVTGLPLPLDKTPKRGRRNRQGST